MHYSETPQAGNSYLHMWDVASTKVFDGGFLFDKTTVPAGTEKLPKGVFLKGDLVERKAILVKTVEVVEAVTAAGTALRVAKGHLLLATDKIGTGTKSITVGTIDTSNEAYDEITIEANALGALAKGSVLQSYDSGVVNPDGLNPVVVDLDKEPSCSIMFRADGIVTSRLPQKPTDAIKDALKDCQFLNL